MKVSSSRIRNCVEAIAAGGKHIAEELAEQVASLKDKQQLQTVERQRMSQELAACEGEVLDAQRVLQAMGKFGLILNGLSRDEQKTLVGLFVERIEVRPGKGDSGADGNVSVRRLQLRLKLNLPRLVEGLDAQAKTQTVGRPSLATGITITAEVALGQQRRSNEALVLSPFRCGNEQTLEPDPAREGERTKATKVVQNPLLRARRWQQMLAVGNGLSLRQLAAKEEVFAPTIVQHLKLLKLAPAIQAAVAGASPQALRFLSLRRLMSLADLPVVEQSRIFSNWKYESLMNPPDSASRQRTSQSSIHARARIRPY